MELKKLRNAHELLGKSCEKNGKLEEKLWRKSGRKLAGKWREFLKELQKKGSFEILNKLLGKFSKKVGNWRKNYAVKVVENGGNLLWRSRKKEKKNR